MEDSVDDFEIVDSDGTAGTSSSDDVSSLDSQILSDVEGCLGREITGAVCDETFTREDIVDYCDQLDDDKKFDACYAIAAAMNNVEEYCYDIENEPLLAKCLERFQA